MSDCENFRNSQVVPKEVVPEKDVPKRPTYEELYRAMVAERTKYDRSYYKSLDRGGDDSDCNSLNNF